MPAGAITASLACSLAQVLVNEANIQRVKYASSFNTPASPPYLDDQYDAKPKKNFLDHVLLLVGVTRATDDEYLQKLKWQRERLLKRIQEVEKEKSEAFDESSSSTSEEETKDGA